MRLVGDAERVEAAVEVVLPEALVCVFLVSVGNVFVAAMLQQLLLVARPVLLLFSRDLLTVAVVVPWPLIKWQRQDLGRRGGPEASPHSGHVWEPGGALLLWRYFWRRAPWALFWQLDAAAAALVMDGAPAIKDRHRLHKHSVP
jgi:hypothetical protein